jgi:hypothetical protein
VRGDGSVLLDSGIVYFSARATQDFLRLARVLPLSSCTSAGLDLGPAPLRFELYTDVLLCMNPAMSKEQFMATPLPDRKSDPQAVAEARELLWATFHPHPFTVIRWDHCLLALCPLLDSCMCSRSQSGAHFAHLGTIAEYMHMLHNDSVSAGDSVSYMLILGCGFTLRFSASRSGWCSTLAP